MKTTHVFESKIREQVFGSTDDARSFIRQSPLIGDYVLDLLVERKVLAVRDDGSVGAVVPPKPGRVGAAKPVVDGAWRPHWPDRAEVIEACRANEVAIPDPDEPNRGATFAEIQSHLKDFGEPHSHWLVLHSVWALVKEGIIEKRGKQYWVTEYGHKKHPRPFDAWTQALQKVGPPYPADAVREALRVIPGHFIYSKHGQKEDYPTQGDVDGVVEARKSRGLL